MTILFLKDGKNVDVPWKTKPIEKLTGDEWFSNLQVAKQADELERSLIIMEKLNELNKE